MAGNTRAVPEGYHTITPALRIRNCAKAIDFYKNAFGAEASDVHYTPDGKVAHAMLRIGDSNFMVSDEFPQMGAKGPESLGGSPVLLNIYVENVDALFNRVVAAGAKVTMPLENQFWGDRYGQVVDPFGHLWALGSHVEDVAPDEMQRRATAAFAAMAKKAGQT